MLQRRLDTDVMSFDRKSVYLHSNCAFAYGQAVVKLTVLATQLAIIANVAGLQSSGGINLMVLVASSDVVECSPPVVPDCQHYLASELKKSVQLNCNEDFCVSERGGVCDTNVCKFLTPGREIRTQGLSGVAGVI